MTATESDIIRAETERSNLQRAIADLETAMVIANPGTRRILELSLAGAKTRVSTLDRQIEEAKVEHAAEVQVQAAVAAALAAKETKLSADEREAYRGFLEKSYFTKRDFGELDEFHTHSYDRLSEGGKEEMSKRIDEGIRRGEFKAADLPESVRKRNASLSRAHAVVGTTEPVGHTSRAETQIHAQAGVSTAMVGNKMPAEPSPAFPNSDLDLSSVDLSGVKLVAASKPTAASIPNASEWVAHGRA